MTTSLPTPHGDKLQALLVNRNLPEGDKPQVHEAVKKYDAWVKEVKQIEGVGDDLVEPLVDSLHRYRKWIDLDLIFDSQENFLHRQRGQLKLDNSVLEEFLPWLVSRRFAEQMADTGLSLGPTNAFSQLSFDSDPFSRTNGGGMTIRSKDHDFAVALPLFLKASHNQDFSDSQEARTNLAYLAVETQDQSRQDDVSRSKRDCLRPEARLTELAILPLVRMAGHDPDQYRRNCHGRGYRFAQGKTYVVECAGQFCYGQRQGRESG